MLGPIGSQSAHGQMAYRYFLEQGLSTELEGPLLIPVVLPVVLPLDLMVARPPEFSPHTPWDWRHSPLGAVHGKAGGLGFAGFWARITGQ